MTCYLSTSVPRRNENHTCNKYSISRATKKKKLVGFPIAIILSTRSLYKPRIPSAETSKFMKQVRFQQSQLRDMLSHGGCAKSLRFPPFHVPHHLKNISHFIPSHENARLGSGRRWPHAPCPAALAPRKPGGWLRRQTPGWGGEFSKLTGIFVAGDLQGDLRYQS